MLVETVIQHFGHLSLGSNTSGDGNVAVGYQSLYSNLTANNNIAVGYEAFKKQYNRGVITQPLVLGL